MRESERASDGEALLQMRFISTYAFFARFMRVRDSVADCKRKSVRYVSNPPTEQNRTRVIHAVGEGTLTVLSIVRGALDLMVIGVVSVCVVGGRGGHTHNLSTCQCARVCVFERACVVMHACVG